jgi:hypothetical protein
MSATEAVPWEAGPIVVRTFVETATAAVRALGSDPGFRTRTTVEQVCEFGLESVAIERITTVFWVRVMFETDRLTGELTYGDREREINARVGRRVPGENEIIQYALWEWVQGFGEYEPRATNAMFVSRDDRVRAVVADIGGVLTAYASRIADAGALVEEQIRVARAVSQAEFQEENRAQDHARAVAQAAEAFRQHDYRRVITLMEPHTAHLTPAERKKLELARRGVEMDPPSPNED